MTSVAALRARGIEPSILDQIASALGEDLLAWMMSGTEDESRDEEIGRVMRRQLEAANYHVRGGEEAWELIGVEIGHGIGGKLLRDRSEAVFNSR